MIAPGRPRLVPAPAEETALRESGEPDHQGHPHGDGYAEYGQGDMAEAFAAGTQAARDLAATAPGRPDIMHLMTIEMGAWCGASGPGNGRASSQWREVTCPQCTAKGMTHLRALVRDMLDTMPASHAALSFAIRAGRLGVTGPDGRPLVPACASDGETVQRDQAAPVTPGQEDPFGGHEFGYESHTDLFRCVRCHRYEVAARPDGGIDPCEGTAPAGADPIEVNAW